MCMSLNRDMLISGGADHIVNVWDTTTLRKLCVLDCGRRLNGDPGVDVISCCALGDGGTIVAGSYDKSLRVWRLPLHESPDNWKSNMITATSRTLSGHTGSILCVALRDTDNKVSNNSSETYFGNEGNNVITNKSFTENDESTLPFDVEQGSTFCLSGSYDSTLKMWDTTSGKCLSTTNDGGHTGPIFDIDSPAMAGRLCLSASQDSTACLWDLQYNFKKIRSFGSSSCTTSNLKSNTGHIGAVKCCQLASFNYGSYLAITGGEDGIINIWDGRSNNKYGIAMSLKGHNGSVNCLQAGGYVLPTLCSGGDDGTVRVWDIRKVNGGINGAGNGVYKESDVNALLVMDNHDKKSIRCLKWHWNKIISSGDSNKVIVHSVHDGKVLFTGTGHGATVTDVCMDESHFMSCSLDSEMRAWFAPAN